MSLLLDANEGKGLKGLNILPRWCQIDDWTTELKVDSFAPSHVWFMFKLFPQELVTSRQNYWTSIFTFLGGPANASDLSTAPAGSTPATAAPSAFHRVGNQGNPNANQSQGVVPKHIIDRNTTPTPVSSTTSESPPTLKRPPFDGDDDERYRDQDSPNSTDQDNAFAWPTHNSYDEQR